MNFTILFLTCLLCIFSKDKGFLYAPNEKLYLGDGFNFVRKKEHAQIVNMVKIEGKRSRGILSKEKLREMGLYSKVVSIATEKNKFLSFYDNAFSLVAYVLNTNLPAIKLGNQDKVKISNSMSVAEKIQKLGSSTFKIAIKGKFIKIQNKKPVDTKNYENATKFVIVASNDSYSEDTESGYDADVSNSETSSTEISQEETVESTKENSSSKEETENQSSSKKKEKKNKNKGDKKDKSKNTEKPRTEPVELQKHVNDLTDKHKKLIDLLNEEQVNSKAAVELMLEKEKLSNKIKELEEQNKKQKKAHEDELNKEKKANEEKLKEVEKTKEEEFKKQLEEKEEKIKKLQEKKKEKSKKEESEESTKIKEESKEESDTQVHKAKIAEESSCEEEPMSAAKMAYLNNLCHGHVHIMHHNMHDPCAGYQQAYPQPAQFTAPLPTPADAFVPNAASIQKIINSLSNLMCKNCL